MHLSTILPAALCLASSTLANPDACPAPAPTTTQQQYSAATKANVTAQIYEWLNDIDRVNFFVDTVTKETDPKVISSMAASALPFAMNEATSNMVVSSEVTLDAKGEAASKALPPGLVIIGQAIKDTISEPQNVKKNVATVNGQRCQSPQGGGGISKEGDVQQAGASAIGIVVPTPAKPLACFATGK